MGSACRSLVRQVQDIIRQKAKDEGETQDYSSLSGHEFKVREMEQQVSSLLVKSCVMCMMLTAL